MVQPNLEQRLRLDSLDVHADAPELDRHADVQLHEVQHLRFERDMRLQVLELEVDLVDLDDRDVEQDIRVIPLFLVLGERVVGVLALRYRALAFDVLREAVLLGLLGGGAAVRAPVRALRTVPVGGGALLRAL